MKNHLRHQQPILFFDGDCVLCNGLVQWVVKKDHRQRIAFASLQSDFAREFKISHGLDPLTLDTFLYAKNGRCFSRSSAVLQLAGDLGGACALLSIGYILPVTFRDALYDLMARRRYRWFGKTVVCRLPDSALRKRLLG